MSYRIEERDGYSVVCLEGQFLGGDETDNLSVFFKAIDKENNRKFIIDFEKVTYISSIVIGILVRFHNEIVDDGGRVAVIKVSPAIMEVFRITRVDMTLSVFQTFEEAVSYLNKDNS